MRLMEGRTHDRPTQHWLKLAIAGHHVDVTVLSMPVI